jgi:hypothetical protein
MLSLMMATLGAAASSVTENSRPWSTPMPMVSKKRGPTTPQ